MDIALAFTEDFGLQIFRYVAVLAFSLALIIALHEFGHFLMARLFGVKILQFSLGFGRELVGRTDKRGTRWSICWFPFGGYVSIFGNVDVNNPEIWDEKLQKKRNLTQEELKVAFCTRKVWQRMLIVFAGPLINLLFTILVFTFYYNLHGYGYARPVITALGIGTAGYDAGFHLGDEILEMDGKKIDRFEQVHEITREKYGIPYNYKVLRNGRTIILNAASRKFEIIDIKGISRLGGRIGLVNFRAVKLEEVRTVNGINTDKNTDLARSLIKENLDRTITIGIRFRDNQNDYFLTSFPSNLNKHLSDNKSDNYELAYVTDPEKIEYRRLPLGESLLKSMTGIQNILVETGRLISVMHKGKTKEPLVGGVARMSERAAESSKSGFSTYIFFLAGLSLGIAILNILPIPILDGGFLMFLLYEAVTGKPVAAKTQDYAFAIGLALLGGIIIIVNLRDLINLVF